MRVRRWRLTSTISSHLYDTSIPDESHGRYLWTYLFLPLYTRWDRCEWNASGSKSSRLNALMNEPSKLNWKTWTTTQRCTLPKLKTWITPTAFQDSDSLALVIAFLRPGLYNWPMQVHLCGTKITFQTFPSCISGRVHFQYSNCLQPFKHLSLMLGGGQWSICIRAQASRKFPQPDSLTAWAWLRLEARKVLRRRGQ